LGYIKDKDVFPLLSSSTVIVMPYKKVEQSGVLNLALNLNIPIVATNIGGLKEILEETKLTVEPDNPGLIEEKLYLILQNKRPPNLNKIYAKIRMDNSLRRVIDDHISIYKITLYE
jgi:glycosyltransferase involved in cell wall biosynthesis